VFEHVFYSGRHVDEGGGAVRWEAQQVGGSPDVLPLPGAGAGADGAPEDGETLDLGGLRATARTFDTPQFRGVTFYEVAARSALNRVPDAARVPFRWTVNPYRGCTHACVYCFARRTHEYLDLDAGADFDTRVVVKVNVAERLRAELAAPRWEGEHVALGTNVDPYQRAEGRYGLMRGVLAALRDAANPFSVLTKGTLVLRDLDLLTGAAAVTDVSTNVSVGFTDEALWRSVEPGTPSPRRRLEVCRELNAAGVPCGVLMAPVLPYLTDSDAQVDEAVAAIAEAGATHVAPIVLHLRPGAREWFTAWLGRNHPHLVDAYARLYARGAYAPRAYQEEVTRRVEEAARRHGVGRTGPARSRHVTPPARPATQPRDPHRQLTLL
jgi:DNA repair photolyase